MNTKYVCLTNGQFFEVHNNNWKQIKDKKKIEKKFSALLKMLKERKTKNLSLCPITCHIEGSLI